MKNPEDYTVAWSDLYNSFVEIINVHYDDRGEAIISAAVPNVSEHHVLFRAHELSRYMKEVDYGK